MATDPGGPRFAVRVDDAVLDEDLAHATDAGRTAIGRAIRDFERGGIRAVWLKRCQPDHQDGTDLPGCVKVYIPLPDGQWGAVFTADVADGVPTLVLLAAGHRHPLQPWTPSVYHVAHRRLHA
ncbi:MAG: hypothetical protein ACRDSN_13105 [Pseudonocardiaceae bacterium]